MVSLINMPVTDGFIGLFDYHNWDAKNNIWKNQLNNDIFFENWEKSTYSPIDNTGLLFGGYEYPRFYLNKNLELKDFTVYCLLRQMQYPADTHYSTQTNLTLQFLNNETVILGIHPVWSQTQTYGDMYHWWTACFGENFLLQEEKTDHGRYCLVTFTGDWEKGLINFFYNGQKKWSQKINKELLVSIYNCGKETDLGPLPHHPASYKCLCISEKCHNDGDVYKNANWILSQYGLKENSIPLALETEETAIAKTLARVRTTQNLYLEMESAIEKAIEDKQGEDGVGIEIGEENIGEDGSIDVIPDGDSSWPIDGTGMSGGVGSTKVNMEDGSYIILSAVGFAENVRLASSGSLFLGDLGGYQEGLLCIAKRFSDTGELLDSTVIGPYQYKTTGPEQPSWVKPGSMVWEETTNYLVRVYENKLLIIVNYLQYATDYNVTKLEPPRQQSYTLSYTPPVKATSVATSPFFE